MEMNQLNAAVSAIDVPPRMSRLPIDDRGYPVPYFVAKIDGKCDFRAVAPGRLYDCYHKQLCWLCGERLGQYKCFVIGPMCSVNRINSEPPSHLECAVFAVQACPFLSKPAMRRNEKDLPQGTIAGEHISHNPGCVAIWITKKFKPKQVRGGVLFELGEPANVLWYCEGRPAFKGEVLEAMYRGLPALERLCYVPGDKEQLMAALARAMHWLPKLEKELDDAGPIRPGEPVREGVRDLREGAAEGGPRSS